MAVLKIHCKGEPKDKEYNFKMTGPEGQLDQHILLVNKLYIALNME